LQGERGIPKRRRFETVERAYIESFAGTQSNTDDERHSYQVSLRLYIAALLARFPLGGDVRPVVLHQGHRGGKLVPVGDAADDLDFAEDHVVGVELYLLLPDGDVDDLAAALEPPSWRSKRPIPTRSYSPWTLREQNRFSITRWSVPGCPKRTLRNRSPRPRHTFGGRPRARRGKEGTPAACQGCSPPCTR
jgi:hypothetical protein